MNSRICRDCKSSEDFIVDTQEGTVVCMCGLVAASRIIDDTAEWRNFSHEETGTGAQDPSRVGCANDPLLEGQGISTVISSADPNNPLPRHNMRVVNDGIDRALSSGFTTIKTVCHNLTLNDEVEETAKIIFKLVELSGKLKCRHHDAVVSAVVFLACKKCNQPRSIQEVSYILNCNLRAVSACHKLIKKIIPLTSNLHSPVQYATRFARKVAFSEELKDQVEVVARKLMDEGILAGKNPRTIAGAVVFFVGTMNRGFGVTFGEVAEVSMMTEATIKSAFKEIERYQVEFKRRFGLV